MPRSFLDEGKYNVVPLRLQTGEEAYVLVERASGAPVRMPIRWVARSRRNAVSANTLRNDLYGVQDLYDWAANDDAWLTAPKNLDAFLAGGGQLSPAQLQALMQFVRERRYLRGATIKPRNLATAGQRIRSIEAFLAWTADPFDRGSPDFVNPADLLLYRNRLEATFKPMRTAVGGGRPDPLTEEKDRFLVDLLSPVRGPGGRIATPLRFPEHHPFSPGTQVRNWLLFLFMRELGLRRAEALKLTLEDMPKPGSDIVLVRRRPDDKADPRTPQPQVKGVERGLPMSPGIRVALRAYTGDPRHPGRRRRGGSPYLFTSSANGAPLSLAGCDQIWAGLAKKYPERLGGLAAHVLRHTWAEDVADDLIANEKGEDTALAILRVAGGWKPGSSTPLHYIQNALARVAGGMLRDYHRALYNTEKAE